MNKWNNPQKEKDEKLKLLKEQKKEYFANHYWFNLPINLRDNEK